MMDNGELDFSSQDVFNNMGDLSGCSMDSLFDNILNDTHACTHTHTCNPRGPDLSHTHTCVHVHTKVFPATPEDNDTSESTDLKSKKRPLGNREAVRKYRKKKKARAASLEDEVVKLRSVNQQLMKKLQGQAASEAEIMRLKCLLVDVRGRIDGEIGAFPYQKNAKCVAGGEPNMAYQNYPAAAYMMNPCDLRCNDQVYCMNSGMDGRAGEIGAGNRQGLEMCNVGNAQCIDALDSELQEPSCHPMLQLKGKEELGHWLWVEEVLLEVFN